MLQKHFKRKLVVILSADAAGYTRLTEQNELSTHSLLKERLELIRENTSKFDGEIIRIHGDGCLCSFDSVVNALKAALEIQHRSTLLNSGLTISNQIWFRIGIHLSEVIFDNCEPYGNGVNIAVRLQQRAKPGEIIVSQKTISALDSTRGFIFSKVKKIKAKNLAQAIYCTQLTGTSIATYSNISKQQKYSRPAIYLALFASVCMFLYSSSTYYYTNKQPLTTFNDHDNTSNLTSKNDVFSSIDIGYQLKLEKKFPTDFTQSTLQNNIVNLANKNENIELLDLTNKINKLSYDIKELKNNISFNGYRPNSQSSPTTNNLLAHQNFLLESLINQHESKQFLRSSTRLEDSFLSFQDYTTPQNLVSTKHLISSLDSLSDENNNITNQNKARLLPTDAKYFGCMSCVNQKTNSVQLTDDTRDNIKNKAILVGNISGNDIKYLGGKNELLRNYIYQKLQYSISQSTLGKQINEFAWLDETESKEVSDSNFIKLCEKKNAILIASYNLLTNYWNANGTHLRFHNCVTDKSIHYFERNLSPTIYNVQEPYLTEEALINVYKSVDYMVNKIVAKNDEELL